jgi:hypothetical protein
MNFNNLNKYISTTKIHKIFYTNEQLAKGIGWTHALMFTHKYCDVPRNKREETT